MTSLTTTRARKTDDSVPEFCPVLLTSVQSPDFASLDLAFAKLSDALDHVHAAPLTGDPQSVHVTPLDTITSDCALSDCDHMAWLAAWRARIPAVEDFRSELILAQIASDIWIDYDLFMAHNCMGSDDDDMAVALSRVEEEAVGAQEDDRRKLHV